MATPPLGPKLAFVFGYLRLPSPRWNYHLAVRRRLAWHCQQNGLRVGRVFIDDNCQHADIDMDISRAAFANMCARIPEEQPYGVLVLRPGDLSNDKMLALRLASQIWATAVELLTVRGELPPRPVAVQDSNPLRSNESDSV